MFFGAWLDSGKNDCVLCNIQDTMDNVSSYFETRRRQLNEYAVERRLFDEILLPIFKHLILPYSHTRAVSFVSVLWCLSIDYMDIPGTWAFLEHRLFLRIVSRTSQDVDCDGSL